MTTKTSNPIYNIGLIFAPWIAHFSAWVLENARHPVRLLLRDADMIDIVVKDLAKNIPDFAPAADWTAHYLTRGILTPLHDYKYIQKLEPRQTPLTLDDIHNSDDTNLQKLFTFLARDDWDKQSYTVVDTGWNGSIPELLNHVGFDLHPLMMFSNRCLYNGFYDTLFAPLPPINNMQKNCSIFEMTPKQNDIIVPDRITDDGEIKPRPSQKAEHAQYKQLKSGLRAGAKRIGQIGIENLPDARTTIKKIEDSSLDIKNVFLDTGTANLEQLQKLAQVIYDK